MTYAYRNHNTGDVVRRAERSGRLDHLPNWELIEAPAPSPDDGDDVKPPAKSAPKPEWVAYAVAKGAHPDDAEALTTRQLIEQYGPTG